MTSEQSWHSVKISFSPGMVRKRIYKNFNFFVRQLIFLRILYCQFPIQFYFHSFIYNCQFSPVLYHSFVNSTAGYLLTTLTLLILLSQHSNVIYSVRIVCKVNFQITKEQIQWNPVNNTPDNGKKICFNNTKIASPASTKHLLNSPLYCKLSWSEVFVSNRILL